MRKPITKEELKALQQSNTVIEMVDIRSEEEYEKLHIPKVMHIPAEDLKDNLIAFDKEDVIICICNHGKERSQQAAELLYNAGFRNSFYLAGGTIAWLNDAMPAGKTGASNQDESSLLHLETIASTRQN